MSPGEATAYLTATAFLFLQNTVGARPTFPVFDFSRLTFYFRAPRAKQPTLLRPTTFRQHVTPGIMNSVFFYVFIFTLPVAPRISPPSTFQGLSSFFLILVALAGKKHFVRHSYKPHISPAPLIEHYRGRRASGLAFR